MLDEVRVLVLSPFNYVYDLKNIYFTCGDMFFLNPASPEGLAELIHILATYQSKSWVYIEESIVNDYKTSTGIFAPVIEKIELNEKREDSVPAESKEITEVDLKHQRSLELVSLNWREIKKIAEGLGIEYTDKNSTIVEILVTEFP